MFQPADSIFTSLKALKAHITQKFLLGYELSSTDAGALSVSTPVTVLTCAASETRTLANGIPGQVKIIFLMTDGGQVVVTPTSLYNGDTITLADVNDAWFGIFYAGSWHTIAGTAAVSVLA
uniref:Uncharacterized protein n=1 Tax=viral metagenome TaxID=1070528 RepID=A0A6M3K6N2_9ZZZZ